MSKKEIIILVSLFLTILVVMHVFFAAQVARKRAVRDYYRSSPRMAGLRILTNYPSDVHKRIVLHFLVGKNLKGELSDILRKVDYSKPDNCSPKNAGWCFYEEVGKQYTKDTWAGSEITLSDISSVSNFIFTFGNRIDGLGTDNPELIIIVPDVIEDACEAVIERIETGKNSPNAKKVAIPKIKFKPDITIHRGAETQVIEEEIVSLPYIEGLGQNNDRPMGCIKYEGINYFYHTVFSF